jgi:hypothetical protein
LINKEKDRKEKEKEKEQEQGNEFDVVESSKTKCEADGRKANLRFEGGKGVGQLQ